MDLEQYTLAGFDILANATAVINTKSILGIFNTVNWNDSKELGGYVADAEFSFMCKTNDLTNPKALKGKVIAINSTSYRIVTVVYGQYVTKIMAQGISKL